MGGIGEVFLGLIALLFLLICLVVAVALPVLAIWWIYKCLSFFVKVPDQLDEIIASLNTIKKQLDSANKSLQDASKPQNNAPNNGAAKDVALDDNKPKDNNTPPSTTTQNTPKTHDAQKTLTEYDIQIMMNSFTPLDH